jgi:VanZ family protein
MLHVGAYFVMASCWFLYLLFSRPDNYSFKAGFVKVSLLVIAFGILIEVLQGALTTFREPDWADGLANSIGVLIALGLFVLFLNPLKNVKHRINSFL